MKKTLVITGFAGLLLLAGGRAEALVITPSTSGWTTDLNKNLSSDALWFSAFGFLPEIPDTLPSLLYKSDAGGADGGTYANAYNTTYSNTPTDPSDALINWGGSFYMDCSVCYLLVKDGNQNPAQYLFDISSWNGTDDIELKGFWPANGAISNVQILGTATRVPEPSTIALVAFGFAALSLRRRWAII
jgi:hypothetical protein